MLRGPVSLAFLATASLAILEIVGHALVHGLIDERIDERGQQTEDGQINLAKGPRWRDELFVGNHGGSCNDFRDGLNG